MQNYECNAAKRTKAYRNYWMAFVCIIFTESIGCASAVLLRYEMLFENVLFSTHTHSKIPIRRMSKPCQITAFFGEMQLGNQCKGTNTYFRCHRVEFDSEIGIFALVPQQQQQRRCFSIKWQWPNHGHGVGGIISVSAYVPMAVCTILGRTLKIFPSTTSIIRHPPLGIDGHRFTCQM